jgi:hypothetical protein
MSYELPIVGPHEIPGFNGVGSINLEDFNRVTPPKQIGGEFQYIGVIDLSTVDENDEMWLNIGIREQGNTEERIESFVNKFEVSGFKTTYVPPIMGTDGKPRDGRGRVIAAKRRGERYIPAYFYAYDDTSERCRVTNGLTENFRHDPAWKATMESVITAGLYLIKLQELSLTETSIRNWMMSDLHVEEHFAGHNITKMVNSIMDRGVDGGDPLTLVQSREKWVQFCEKAKIPLDNKSTFLFAVDSETYPFRAWCQHVLPAIVDNRAPVQLILYTNKHVPAEARKLVKNFQAKMEYLLDSSYLMVEKDYSPVLNLPVKTVPFEILGCVPQVIGKHDKYMKSSQLVPVQDY